MPADVVQSDYDQLDKVAGKFAQQSQAMAEMVQSVIQSYEPLHSDGWKGRGSQAFFREMQGEVFPAVRRLIQALSEANRVTRQIGAVLRQAEEEASAPFKSGSEGGAGAGAGQCEIRCGTPGGSPGTVQQAE